MRRAALLAALLAGCGGGAPAMRAERTPSPAPGPAPTSAPAEFEPVRCPPDLQNCAAVTGRVIYVEAVDPDGDGDAHYVLAGGDVTAPGITAVDVRPSLRPRRLARVGERVSAAGPVFTGSFGQRQIEAVRIRHDR